MFGKQFSRPHLRNSERGRAMPSTAEFAAWVRKLTSREAANRNRTASLLAYHVGPEQVGLVPVLVNGLREGPSVAKQKWSAVALGRIGPAAASALPALEEALKCDYWPVRWAVLDAIRAIDVAGSVPASTLIAALERTVKLDPLQKHRGLAAHQLGLFGAKAASAVPALIDLLNSRSRWAQLSAATTLGEIGPDACDALPRLTSLSLNDDQIASVRKAAADAITKITAAQ